MIAGVLYSTIVFSYINAKKRSVVIGVTRDYITSSRTIFLSSKYQLLLKPFYFPIAKLDGIIHDENIDFMWAPPSN